MTKTNQTPVASVMQADESGWLIERETESGPVWLETLAEMGDDGWTKDSLEALRFARRCDADVFATYYLGEPLPKDEYRITEHLWSMRRPEKSEQSGYPYQQYLVGTNATHIATTPPAIDDVTARDLFEIARPFFHYARRGTGDGGKFEASETGRMLMKALGAIIASLPTPRADTPPPPLRNDNSELHHENDAQPATPFSTAEHPHSGHALVADANSVVIADCGNGECLTPKQEWAHACLFAAAPDLLEELEQQADGCSTIAALLKGQDSPVAASLRAMLRFQEANARAAIAKARP